MGGDLNGANEPVAAPTTFVPSVKLAGAPGGSILYRQPEPGPNSAHHTRSAVSRRKARVHWVTVSLLSCRL